MHTAPTAHDVARRLARAIASDPAFGSRCLVHFGKGPHVFLDTVGARDWEDLYPFAVVSPEAEAFGRGERSLVVNALLCIRAVGEEPGSAKPVQSPFGFFEMPGADTLQDVAAGLVGAVRNAAPGAIFDDWSVDWDFGSEWPEQSALLTFNFHNGFTFTP